MAEAKTDLAPAAWQVTATTVQCGIVQDYVTLTVYKKWSCKCTWWAKYKEMFQHLTKCKRLTALAEVHGDNIIR